MKNKILSLKKIKKTVSELKKKKVKIGLCHGVFDLLHYGHISHFKSAKKNCDYLIVSVTSDRFVNKGIGRPAFSQKIRMNSISALESVDKVLLSDFPSAEKILNLIKPNLYFKGSDYKNLKDDITNKIKKEINIIKRNGGNIFFTDEPTSSSSQLINKYFNSYDNQQNNFLNNLKRKYNIKGILKHSKKIKNFKALVIGETIIDEYSFSEVMGKSGKESYLAIKDIKTENHLGGAAAVAKHLSSFCKEVKLLSMIGEKKEHLNFIKKNLGNIKSDFIFKENSPTIVKKRYIDNINKNKLIGVYKINDQILNEKQNKQLIKKYKKMVKTADLVIISDYGHGFVTKGLIKLIEKENKKTYLNAQVNSANLGYHSILKYKKVHCLVINELELRHEMRDKVGDIVMLAKKLQKKIDIKKIIITRGKFGAILIDKNSKKVFNCPAFTSTVVDKVGAGDTMLSILCLFINAKTEDELSLFLGNIAGSLSVKVMGNKEHLDKITFFKQIETILK